MRRIGLLFAALLVAGWDSDNYLSLTYSPTTKQPNLPTNHSNHGTDIGSFRVAINHLDNWRYGSNYLLLGFTKDNTHDPERNNLRNGATQFFGEWRSELSGNALAGGELFHNIVLRDLRLETAVAFNDKNSALGNKKKLLLLGPNFKFNLPGVVTLGIHYAHEWNYNAIVGKSVIYQPALQVEILVRERLPTNWPLYYQGIANIVTPKGHDGFGRQTVTEFFTQHRLILDAGELFWQQPRRLELYVGGQFWYNKLGGNHVIKSGSVEQTAFFGSAVHF